MRKKLNWVDVLNLQTQWLKRADMMSWLTEVLGRQTNVLDGTVEGFEEALGFMRRQVGNLHFGEPVDLLWLDTQLKTISLGLLHHQGAQEGAGSKLPQCRARVKGLHDTDLLRAVKDSLLVQFAEYIGDTLDNGGKSDVRRCEGVHRESTSRLLPAEACFPPQVEARWLNELATVGDAPTEEGPAVLGTSYQRCPNLFVGGPKSKFCSDACRFASFQIAKQTQEPDYLAEKQRRYRRRQEKRG